jgi:hypothetical protein
VAAHIIKAAHLIVLVPGNDQTFTRHFGHEVITGVSDLSLMPNQHPIFRKDPVSLVGENLWGDEILLRQRFRASLQSLRRFAKL